VWRPSPPEAARSGSRLDASSSGWPAGQPLVDSSIVRSRGRVGRPVGKPGQNGDSSSAMISAAALSCFRTGLSASMGVVIAGVQPIAPRSVGSTFHGVLWRPMFIQPGIHVHDAPRRSCGFPERWWPNRSIAFASDRVPVCEAFAEWRDKHRAARQNRVVSFRRRGSFDASSPFIAATLRFGRERPPQGRRTPRGPLRVEGRHACPSRYLRRDHGVARGQELFRRGRRCWPGVPRSECAQLALSASLCADYRLRSVFGWRSVKLMTPGSF